MDGLRTSAILLITVAVCGLLFVGSFGVGVESQNPVLRVSLASSVTPFNNTTYCGVLGPNPGNTSDTAPEYFPNVTAVWNKLCVNPLFDSTLTNWGGLYNNTTAHALRSHNITIGETNASYVTNGTPWRYDPSAQANFFVSWVQSCANNTSLNCDRSAEWEGNLSSYTITGPFNTSICDCGGRQGWSSWGRLLTFVENGLPNGTTWSITINGSTWPTSAGTLTFELSSGVYPYAVGNVSGFSASPSTGFVTMNGVAVETTINFRANASSASPTLLGLPPAVAYVVLGTTLGAVATLIALFVWQKRVAGERARPQQDRRPSHAK
jgi:hypothetical protein